jgi:hypothetical protein
MARRVRDRDSSLELLLDTITNTFGGILFIAILVSLMLRSTSQHASQEAARHEPMSPLEQARLENRINGLRTDVEVLTKRIAAAPPARAAGGESVSMRGLEAAAAALQAALDDRAEAAASMLELQRQAAESRAQAAALGTEQATAEARLAAAEQKVTVAKEEAARLAAAVLALEEAAAKVVERTVGLPNLRPSAKEQVGLYLRFDRLFMMHDWEGGRRLGPNTDQFVVVPVEGDDGVQQVARPKPGAGLPVAVATVRETVRRLLAPFPPGRFVVSLIVFDDSFDVFQLVKGAIVDAGYEYRPMPLRSGQSVVDFGGVGEAQ